jgi:aspartyl-tRNA(Asn)/glutamyl-tRNA(Gln) amidotransferase subunit C
MLKEQQIIQISKLAKLDVSGKTEDIAKDLNGIMNIIDDLQAIDTTGVEPMAHPFDGVQRLRVDEVSESDNRELYQQNAPLTEQGHYLVPKVL